MRRAAARPDNGDSSMPIGSPAGRHLAPGSRHIFLKVLASGLAFVLVAGLGFAAFKFWQLQNNVQTSPLNANPEAEATAKLPVDTNKDPLQILIIGTDTRTGQTSITDEDNSSGEGNADVMMLMNMSADRQRVTVVSFPRDLMTKLPACKNPDTGQIVGPYEIGQLNTTLAEGGPGCTVAAINEMTGLEIDHFMMADFNAVRELSNTLGGVEVCVNAPVDDPSSGLKLPAGVSTVQGDEALAFLRNRKGFGDGSDIGRIRSQQSFLASMVRKIRAEDTLNNIPKMYGIAEAITQNLTVDPALKDISTLMAMAGRLKDVDLNNVAFITAPVVTYEPDPNRVQLDEPKAEDLFAILREDGDPLAQPSQEPAPEGSGTPTDGTQPTPETTIDPITGQEVPVQDPAQIDPATINVTVSNRSSAGAQRADEIVSVLQGLGFTLAVSGDTAAVDPSVTLPATQILVPQGQEDAGKAVARQLGISDSQVVTNYYIGGITLVIGDDFLTGDKLDSAANLGDGLSGQTAGQSTCQSVNTGFGF